MSIDQDKLDIALEKKQNSMLDIKQGFYSPSEGEDGDTGLCVNNGKRYFGVKIQDQWEFAELGLTPPSLVSMDTPVKIAMRKFFSTFLYDNSLIIANIVPARFSVPFITFVYTDNGGTRRIPSGEYISSAPQTHNVDVSGIWSTLAKDTWTELDGYLGTGGTIAKYIIPPYACRLKKIIFRGSFDVSGGNDTDDTTVAMSFISKNATNTTDANTSQSATTPDNVVTGGHEALWVFSFSTGWTIPVDGYAAFNYTVAEPTNSKLRMMQGIAVFTT